MTQEEWERALEQDGYSKITAHKDPPDFEYPKHDHPIDTAYVTLKGDMKIWIEGEEYNMPIDKRLDVKKHAVHWSTIGKQGCEFLVAVRI